MRNSNNARAATRGTNRQYNSKYHSRANSGDVSDPNNQHRIYYLSQAYTFHQNAGGGTKRLIPVMPQIQKAEE